MKTLLDKLRPEIIEALEENRGKYDFSITDLYEELNDMYIYRQLTVGQIRDIILYADIDAWKWDYIDWKFGDKIFVEDN